MKEKIVLVGGGEHARVLIDLVRASGLGDAFQGYAAPTADAATEKLGIPWIGTDDGFDPTFISTCQFVLAVGATGKPFSLRQRIGGYYDGRGVRWLTLVHPTAVVSGRVEIGAGSQILAGAIVQPGVSTGRLVVVNTGAIVEHDVKLGDYVQIAPRCVVGGGTSIGQHTQIGLGAAVRDHLTVGERVEVAMGSVVVNNVANDSRVMGVPARPQRADS